MYIRRDFFSSFPWCYSNEGVLLYFLSLPNPIKSSKFVHKFIDEVADGLLGGHNRGVCGLSMGFDFPRQFDNPNFSLVNASSFERFS